MIDFYSHLLKELKTVGLKPLVKLRSYFALSFITIDVDNFNFDTNLGALFKIDFHNDRYC